MSDFYSSQELEQLEQRGVRILLPEQTAIRRDVDLQQQIHTFHTTQHLR